ncbi:hypothetical protein [Halanaerobium salsuginis]|jgi:hypothetical protein|uniref:DUF2953 domain-containing protein n=1 Tax=Halanaerobium salsuginis TaxID=29563 RepID=A0A1I4N2T8_9FIRM|nr:hypothetical protein [Halanaerobium salsuginis]SFM09627.1 hypothetical protein SAMN02983006_02790 [Halanaerobium salsuginis]
MLNFIFIIFVSIISCLFLSLFIPLKYKIKLDYNYKLAFLIKFSYLGINLIFKKSNQEKIWLLKFSKYSKKINLSSFFNKNKISNKTKAKEGKLTKLKDLKFYLDNDNFSQILAVLKKILKIIVPSHLKLKIDFSLGDPYYNALFIAGYYALKDIFSKKIFNDLDPEIEINLNWQEVKLDFEFLMTGRIKLWLFCWQLITYLSSAQNRHFLNKLSQLKRKD